MTIVRCALLIVLAAASTGVSGQPRSELRGGPGLVRVYDDILDARFDEAASDLRGACPPAPEPACDVMAATTAWWRILLDPDSRAFDAEFAAGVEHAIGSTAAWAERDPDSAEAHFYSGAAYALRVQWRVLRGEKIAAARDGKHIKQQLDRAVTLDPGLEDANFGIGLYEYYADTAPAAAKLLRFLLLLPGGDRADGLARMQRARTHGELLQGEADYQLQIIDLWYEHRADRAVDLLKGLRERYPGNPLFTAQLADVEERYLHDTAAALDDWRDLLADALAGRVNDAPLAEAEARLGIARGLDALCETDQSLDQLRALVASKPERPFETLAAAYLELAKAEDRLGHRDSAVAAYRLAVSSATDPDVHNVKSRAENRLAHAPDPKVADAYRLALEGWRKVEHGNAADGEALLAQSLALNPADPVAHYRAARALDAMRQEDAAAAQFDAALRDARDCPPPIAAAAFLGAAQLRERTGDRAQAIVDYRAARDWFGGAPSTRDAATRALLRLRADK
jgi:hypothetical protein